MTKPFRRDSVHLPGGLSLLVKARADAQGASGRTILHESLISFCHLSTEVRQALLHNYHWSELSSRDWVEHVLDAETLKVARLAKLGAWSLQQTILAAVSWFLAVPF
jgi:hypothetical protein